MTKLKKQQVFVNVYTGTKIIKSYPKENEKKDSQHQTLIKQAKANASGLWADVINAYENKQFETMWGSDISVEYCSMNQCGDMIDITIDNNGTIVCFNMDKDSIYISCPENDRDKTLELSTFPDFDSLIVYMKNCAEKTSLI